MLKKIALAVLATAGLVAASASQGCGSSTPSCDDSCKCTGSEGDQKCLDTCQKSLDDEDAAAVKDGCESAYDDYQDCVSANVVCGTDDNNNPLYGIPKDRCTVEYTALCKGKCTKLATCTPE